MNVGKLAFVAVMLVLAIWLLLIPRSLIGQEERVPPPWRNVRWWAVGVAVAQLLVYAVWG
jgi:hypothetical protein